MSTSDPLLIGLVSISDRASAGVYEDKGMPGLNEWFTAALKSPWRMETRLIPDEQPVIERTLIELVDVAGCHLVLTTGGTGPAPRDVTPEATLAVAHKVMPGFGEQMRQVSLQVRADRDPVAAGRRDPRPRADPQPAGAAEGDQGNARRRLPRGPLLHRPDRRPVHRDERRQSARRSGRSQRCGRSDRAQTHVVGRGLPHESRHRVRHRLGGGFGAMAILARVAYAAGVDVVTLLALRFALAAAAMLVIARWRGVVLPSGTTSGH